MKIRLFLILMVLCMTVPVVVCYASSWEQNWEEESLTTIWADLKTCFESDIFADFEVFSVTGCNSDAARSGDAVGTEVAIQSYRTTAQYFDPDEDCIIYPPEVTSFVSGGFIMFVTVYEDLGAGIHTMEVGIIKGGSVKKVLTCQFDLPISGTWCLGCYVDPIPKVPSITLQWKTRLDGGLITPGSKTFTIN